MGPNLSRRTHMPAATAQAQPRVKEAKVAAVAPVEAPTRELNLKMATVEALSQSMIPGTREWSGGQSIKYRPI